MNNQYLERQVQVTHVYGENGVTENCQEKWQLTMEGKEKLRELEEILESCDFQPVAMFMSATNMFLRATFILVALWFGTVFSGAIVGFQPAHGNVVLPTAWNVVIASLGLGAILMVCLFLASVPFTDPSIWRRRYNRHRAPLVAQFVADNVDFMQALAHLCGHATYDGILEYEQRTPAFAEAVRNLHYHDMLTDAQRLNGLYKEQEVV